MSLISLEQRSSLRITLWYVSTLWSRPGKSTQKKNIRTQCQWLNLPLAHFFPLKQLVNQLCLKLVRWCRLSSSMTTMEGPLLTSSVEATRRQVLYSSNYLLLTPHHFPSQEAPLYERAQDGPDCWRKANRATSVPPKQEQTRGQRAISVKTFFTHTHTYRHWQHCVFKYNKQITSSHIHAHTHTQCTQIHMHVLYMYIWQRRFNKFFMCATLIAVLLISQIHHFKGKSWGGCGAAVEQMSGSESHRFISLLCPHAVVSLGKTQPPTAPQTLNSCLLLH